MATKDKDGQRKLILVMVGKTLIFRSFFLFVQAVTRPLYQLSCLSISQTFPESPTPKRVKKTL